ncbi:metallophosphoesterase family protein [Magnetospirillum molischianum]|uniref:Predicted phosphohydrolase n=1 Tax=Magnetospirillum molischianum DSM 120 TaxID=1150626 RepID=H8FRB8_MAGML|nr:metallophosphoesterase [Magnetospirillum molischianum]CCG40906.1 Predicted phosphohydrolase [Magnetospirillum molischianum DSM 120]
MRTVAHLSDLHFGRTDPRLVGALLADLDRTQPDLVAISGDLTQRARSNQFAEARAFLDRLTPPVVLVPGNHDLSPLYRPLNRLLRPRDKFNRHLPRHTFPSVWRDQSLIAIGLDSTRPLRWKSGALTDTHLDELDRLLANIAPDVARMVFLHHPPAAASGGHPYEALIAHGIDVVLSGHAHHTRVEPIIAPTGGALVLVQASTACSTRLRGESNGYCLIRLDRHLIEVTVQGWNGDHFHPMRHHRFIKQGADWRRHP